MPHRDGAELTATGVKTSWRGAEFELSHGSVVIAAITSCTNTSNPYVMVGAGLLAKKAVEKGLTSKPWVKTSLAPGSKVVTDYLDEAGLTEPLEALNFHLVGYGCTTCIGNSGPLPAPIKAAIDEGDLVACSVLSGNRNFEGRIGPDIRANYLASPPLVVAYALAGRVDFDFETEPLGEGADGADLSRRHLAECRGGRPGGEREPACRRCSPRSTARSSRATSSGRRCRCRRARPTPGRTTRPT